MPCLDDCSCLMKDTGNFTVFCAPPKTRKKIWKIEQYVILELRSSD